MCLSESVFVLIGSPEKKASVKQPGERDVATHLPEGGSERERAIARELSPLGSRR